MKALKITSFLIIIFSFIGFTSVRNSNDDYIYWDPERKLVWEDFQGSVDRTQPHIEALTASTIEVSSSYYKNEVPKFNVVSFFIKSQSWTKTNSEFTLEHEQLHFDITEIHARKLRKAIDSLSKRKVTDINKYKKAHTYYGKLCSNYQNAYDKSVYGHDERQAEWSAKVAAELVKLEKYAYVVPEE